MSTQEQVSSHASAKYILFWGFWYDLSGLWPFLFVEQKTVSSLLKGMSYSQIMPILYPKPCLVGSAEGGCRASSAVES